MNRRDFLAALPALAALGCGRSSVSSLNPAVPEGSTAFATDLYGQLRKTPGNLFCSPLSISIALAMTARGAGGDTLKEMGQVLHLPVESEQLHADMGAFVKGLVASGSDSTPELRIANALWGQSGTAFRDDFLKSIEKHYGGSFKTVDFAKSAAAAKEINAWVEAQTKSLIKGVMSPDDLDNLTRLVLVNAIYFKGLWTEAFRRSDTSDHDFFTMDNKSVRVPMMWQKAHFLYGEGQDYQALQMSYRGGNLAMLIILPRARDGLTALEAKLSPEVLKTWIGGLNRNEVSVDMPRFRTESTIPLNETLAFIGMPKAFSNTAADFSRMVKNEQLYIAKVLHKAYVDVNEEGTEAAAVTVVETKKEEKRKQPLIFRADHPFLFLIRDTKTGGILFLGRVENPAAG